MVAVIAAVVITDLIAAVSCIICLKFAQIAPTAGAAFGFFGIGLGLIYAAVIFTAWIFTPPKNEEE